MLKREPLKERYLQITNKLSTLDVKAGNCKAHRIDKVNERSSQLEERVKTTISKYNKQLQAFKEQIAALSERVEQEKQEYTSESEVYQKRIEDIQNRVQSRLAEETSARTQSQQQLQYYLNEKMTYLQSDLGNESKLREEMIQEIHSSLEQSLPKIFNAVGLETDDRAQADNFLVKKASAELRLNEKQIEDSIAKRGEFEEKVINMMTELVHRSKADLDDLKETRLERHEEIMCLIEQACDRMVLASKI